MANLTAVTVELNVQGEREATAALKNFKSEQDKLSTSVLGSARKLESINSRWAEADRLLSKGTISTKAHAAAQKQLGRELAALNGMYDTKNRLLTRQATNQLKNAQAAKQAEQAQAQYAKRMEELKLRLDPVYRASQQYKKSLRELIQVQKATGMGMDEYRKSAALLKQEFQRVSQGGRGVRRSMSNVNIAVQQAGFQFSDFAIQVQSGTNMFVAFSQQASQLVGVLPLVARDIGLSAKMAVGLASGLGLAIPLLSVAGSVFIETAMGAKKAGDDVETFEDKLKSARSEVRGMADDLELVRRGFQNAFERTLTDQIEEAEASLTSARAELERYQRFQDQGLGVRITGMTGSQVEDAVNAAEERVRQAELELASAKELVRQKKEQERAESDINQLREARIILDEQEKEFNEDLRGIEQQVAMQEAILAHGKDSLEVLKLETQQRIENYEIQVKQEVVNKKYREDLIVANRELENLVLSNTAIAAGSSAIATIWSNIRDRISEAVDKANEMPAANFGEQGATYEYDAATGTYRIRGTSPGNPAGNLGYETGGSGSLAGASSGGGGGGGRGGGGGDSRERSASAYIQELEREADLRRSLIGLSEEQRERAERRFEIQEQVSELEGTISKDRIQQLVNEEQQIDRLMEQEEERRANIEQLEGRFNSFFLSIHDDIGDLEDAFRSMLRSIIKDTFQRTVSEPISKSLGGFFGGLFSANGNAFNSQGVMAFADGGVVNSPTPFRFGSGGQPGVMGEAGPEAILPLSRGSNGKLGVQSSGGQVGGTATIRLVAPEGFTAMQEGRIQGIAVEVASEGLAEYDRSELPRSVERINKDPRLRG